MQYNIDVVIFIIKSLQSHHILLTAIYNVIHDYNEISQITSQ